MWPDIYVMNTMTCSMVTKDVIDTDRCSHMQGQTYSCTDWHLDLPPVQHIDYQTWGG